MTTVHAPAIANTPYYPGLFSVAYKSDQTSDGRQDSHTFLHPQSISHDVMVLHLRQNQGLKPVEGGRSSIIDTPLKNP